MFYAEGKESICSPKKYILYVLILEGRGKYLFSCGRKGKVSVLIWNNRESIYCHNEEKGKYWFSKGRKGKVSVLIKKKREIICSHKKEKGKHLFS